MVRNPLICVKFEAFTNPAEVFSVLQPNIYHHLEVPKLRCKWWSDRCFAVGGAKVWNILPFQLQTH